MKCQNNKESNKKHFYAKFLKRFFSGAWKLEIFMVWNGGMSFHGGLIGVVAATYLFSRKKLINQFLFLDAISMASPIGLFLGRIANFINSELYGRPADILWSVNFIKIELHCCNSTQIYFEHLEQAPACNQIL